MVDVLEHVEDDDRQIKRVCDQLKKGGQFLIVVPAYPFLFGQRDRDNGHYRRYRKKELCEKLAKNGFTIQSVRYWNALGFLPYLFFEKVLKKPLYMGLRTAKKRSLIKRIMGKCLFFWVQVFENNIDFFFGLTLVCIAQKSDRQY
jgi:SAM-dependent methyltransferase